MIHDMNYANHYLAEDGKAISSKENPEIKTTSIWLGKFDSIENYEEIDKPEEEERNESIEL